MENPWSKPYRGITFARCDGYMLIVRKFDTFILAYVTTNGATTWLAEFYFGKGEVKAAKQALENYAHTLLHGGH